MTSTASQYWVEPDGDDEDTRWCVIHPDGHSVAQFEAHARAERVAFELNHVIPALFNCPDPTDGIEELIASYDREQQQRPGRALPARKPDAS